jgi:hypothetical protein
MSHPPGTKLPQDRCLARGGHLAGPFSVHAQAEGAAGNKGEIDQFNLESLLRLEVDNEQAVMRFGAQHARFCRSNTNATSQKSKTVVHKKMYSSAHILSGNSS